MHARLVDFLFLTWYRIESYIISRTRSELNNQLIWRINDCSIIEGTCINLVCRRFAFEIIVFKNSHPLSIKCFATCFLSFFFFLIPLFWNVVELALVNLRLLQNEYMNIKNNYITDRKEIICINKSICLLMWILYLLKLKLDRSISLFQQDNWISIYP